jgi:autotransporter-associated beta strand protein
MTTGADGSSTGFSGTISGAGGITKTGGGTFTLSSNNLYSGDTIIAAGRLDVEGSIASSAVTVESGATLAGKGLLGSLSVKAGGSVAPGALTPFTTLNVVGNASFASGSSFQVNVDTAGRNDKLAVGGKASIQGGTVQVLFGQGIFVPTTRYTLVSARAACPAPLRSSQPRPISLSCSRY